MIYPIAEIFHSVQGEGVWTGTPMMFVRLAGCCVGEYPRALVDVQRVTNITESTPFGKYSICTTFDGQRFLCDTDYHLSKKMTAEEIAAELEGEHHVCITGGEPLMHDLEPLLKALRPARIHIETSGVKEPPTWPTHSWYTVSPKRYYLVNWFTYADEFKLLVGSDYDEEAFDVFMAKVEPETPVYLQPINGVSEVDEVNMLRVMEMLRKYPWCRLSAQLHKYLKVR